MENLVERLNALKIHGAKIKKVLDTEKMVYLLYSDYAEHGVKSWFNDNEINIKWDLKLYSGDLKNAEEIGFKFNEEERKILIKEGYNLLGFKTK